MFKLEILLQLDHIVHYPICKHQSFSIFFSTTTAFRWYLFIFHPFQLLPYRLLYFYFAFFSYILPHVSLSFKYLWMQCFTHLHNKQVHF